MKSLLQQTMGDSVHHPRASLPTLWIRLHHGLDPSSEANGNPVTTGTWDSAGVSRGAKVGSTCSAVTLLTRWRAQFEMPFFVGARRQGFGAPDIQIGFLPPATGGRPPFGYDSTVDCFAVHVE